MRNFLKRIGQTGYAASRRVRNLTFALGLVVSPAFAAEPVTIVALGDSLTAGYGLPAGEGFVPQLQTWLDRQGAGAIVLNAGVSGDTTAGGLSRVDWALGPEADALIVTLGGNDMLRGIPVAEVRANMTGIMEAAKARGLPVLIVGMKAPLNWGPDYKRDFDAIYPELAAEYGALLADNFFAGLIATGADPSDPASLNAWMQPDGIHPNAAGVILIVEGLGAEVMRLIAAARAQ
ncbi:arylesterase [Rhodobacter sp. 24-YEA-8]|uniref:arylesterase n=1 Tax=Rhodobacter sp. 24-YEA-8 TaxID=1884310 RepID=UPI0008990A3E|nr:arylesterase [Rhodobacter sp. 24-YEA-8]SEC79099.1 acyl-CoA thioesterase-1 [Rhodobacter sp. 24-YEA-8]